MGQLLRGILRHGRLASFLLFLLPAPVSSGQSTPGGSHSIQQVVDSVRSNEQKLSLIRMRFHAKFSSEGQTPEQSSDPRAGSKRAVRHEEIEWAQDGIRQYFVHRDTKQEDDGSIFGEISVVDGEVYKSADWPALKRGTVRDVSKYDRWMVNYAALLYYRPFYRPGAGARLLSETLASAEVVSDVALESLNDRQVYLLDVRFQETPSAFKRLYVDRQRGLLLRSDTFYRSPETGEERLVARTELSEVHETENGGWVAVEGRRIFFGDGFTGFMEVRVDVNSVSVRREDIPESLFELDFPEHTIVHNDVLGMGAHARADKTSRRLLVDLREMPASGEASDDPQMPPGEETMEPLGSHAGEFTEGVQTGLEGQPSSPHAVSSTAEAPRNWIRPAVRQVALCLAAAGGAALLLLMFRVWRT